VEVRTTPVTCGGAVAAACITVLAACGSSGGGSSSSSSASGSAEKASAQLAHVPTGTADVEYDAATKVLTVTISVTGAAPKVTMPSHIHKGTCAGPPGDILYTLDPGVADDKGVVKVTTKVPNVDAVPTGAYLHFHTGPTTATPPEKKSIVCGDLNGQTGMIKMGPNGAVGDNPSGTATLSLDPSTGLSVKLVLDGLEPGSAHPAHIHAGSCEAQGPVVLPLPAVIADTKGHAEVSATLQAASIGTWYVNVHRGPGLMGPEFTPIACGNVTRT